MNCTIHYIFSSPPPLMLIVKLLNLTYDKILQEMVSLKLIETANYKSPAGE